MTRDQQRLSQPLPPYSADPSQAVLLERQSHIIHQLDRMEWKIDQIPTSESKPPPAPSLIAQIIGDPKSIVGLLFLAMLLTGHLTLVEIKGLLLK